MSMSSALAELCLAIDTIDTFTDSSGFLVWFPILRPSLATPSFSHAAAATAFIGGSIFEIGSYFMVIEALDR